MSIIVIFNDFLSIEITSLERNSHNNRSCWHETGSTLLCLIRNLIFLAGRHGRLHRHRDPVDRKDRVGRGQECTEEPPEQQQQGQKEERWFDSRSLFRSCRWMSQHFRLVGTCKTFMFIMTNIERLIFHQLSDDIVNGLWQWFSTGLPQHPLV